MKNMDDLHYEGKPSCATTKSTLFAVSKKNMDDLHYEGKQSCATAKSTLFTVSKDEWDTKEDTDKSMKNALQYAKRHLSG